MTFVPVGVLGSEPASESVPIAEQGVTGMHLTCVAVTPEVDSVAEPGTVALLRSVASNAV
jgi:hypothetical protein